MKTVDYRTFRIALEALNDRLNPDQRGFTRDVSLETNGEELFDRPISLKVNWCCKGAVDPAEAEAFAAKLAAAVEAARSFEYNGFVITYGKGC